MSPHRSPRERLGRLVVALCVAGCGASHPVNPPPQATEPPAKRTPLPPEPSAPVAQTPHFTFFSRFDFNLHDRLLRWAISADRTGAPCVEKLAAVDRDGWHRAVLAFGAFRDEHAKFGLRVRLALAHPSMDFGGRLGEVPSWYRPALVSASAAYRACWWSDDDRANRAWVAELSPRLAKAESPLATRIAAAHHESWEAEPISVDLVPYVSDEGASTVNPAHILVGTAQRANQGFAALEIVFHEASHTMVSPRSGASILAIQAAAQQSKLTLPRNLWHAVLFITAGEIARETIREQWGEAYQPYVYAQGLFERAWPELRAPLEQHWVPYLQGKSTFDEATKGLAGAFAGQAETPRAH